MPSVNYSVGVDNNQLQDQACDQLMMIEKGFKSNLIRKICPGNSYLTNQCFINLNIMIVHSHIYVAQIEFRCFALLF